jgi:glycosyltransferase involved in cell wall biosynthesis
MPRWAVVDSGGGALKVLLVADSYPPAAGGTAAHVLRLAENLCRRGAQVKVLAGSSRDAIGDVEGIPCQRVKLALSRLPGAFEDADAPFVPPWADRRFTAAIRASLSEWAPDVVHAHGWSEVSAAEATRGTSTPLVVTLHDYGLLCPQKSLFRDGAPCRHSASVLCGRCPGSGQGDLKRLGLAAAIRGYVRKKPADLYLAVSSHVRTAHLGALPGRRIIVIPNFIDLSDDGGTPQFPQTPRALFVGPDMPYKGLAVFRAAYELLAARGWRGEFRHVGGKTDETSGGFRSCGRLRGAALEQEYRECSVVVAPALYADPCPTVLLEAMRARRPVIASRTGGHTDIVGSEAGMLVDVGDVAATAMAIDRLTGDHGALARLGRGARTRVEDFSSSAVIPRVEAAYASVNAAAQARRS